MSRRSVEAEGLIHANPIPSASRIGPYLTSSIIPPYNPGTREFPDDIDGQIANLFAHVGQILDAGGGTWDDVAKMTFYVLDRAAARDALNGPWEEHFPDPASRPARHSLVVETSRYHVSCDVVAWIED